MSNEYQKCCFVAMPFGKKQIGTKRLVPFLPLVRQCTFDFDKRYDDILEPAIRAAKLPEGGTLEARRCDRDYFSAQIPDEMNKYLEYSRMVLVDISGSNVNVFYELGIRHRSQQSGTVILRDADTPIPFDIGVTRVFVYDAGRRAVAKSRELITKYLEESLKYNRIDSPLWRESRRSPARDNVALNLALERARNAQRNMDLAAATEAYRDAVAAAPDNAVIRVSLGLLLKDRDQLIDAKEQFARAVELQPAYADAHRELGVTRSLLYRDNPNGPTGEQNLLEALALDPRDYDARSALAGLYKRLGRFAEATAMYRQASEDSGGNSYPLLNFIKLQTYQLCTLNIEEATRFQLERAKRALLAQVSGNTPYNAPWSFFDLAEIEFYLGDTANSLKTARVGLLYAQRWQAKSFLDSLGLLSICQPPIPQLDELLSTLNSVLPNLN